MAEPKTCLHTHRAPPQGISIGGEFFVELVLHKVDEERREDENQEADIPGSDQLLQAEVRADFQCGTAEDRINLMVFLFSVYLNPLKSAFL